MMTFKIDRNIPIPTARRGTYAKYPFKTMKVGESFAIPCTDDTVHRVQINAMAATRNHKPRKFRSAVEREGKSTYVRVWRLA